MQGPRPPSPYMVTTVPYINVTICFTMYVCTGLTVRLALLIENYKLQLDMYNNFIEHLLLQRHAH